MFFIVDLAHTGAVAAFVVDQNEAFGTFATDVAEDVVLTSQDVDVTLTFIEMIELSAFKAEGLIL